MVNLGGRSRQPELQETEPKLPDLLPKGRSRKLIWGKTGRPDSHFLWAESH